jgi:hypothetical protein
VTGVPAVAQSDDGIDPAAVSNINAHRVDGRHAVKMTSNVDLRKGRLMAFSGQGYLPANIVQGGVATIAALQSAVGAVNEADNPVHWNQIQGVPPTIADGVDHVGYASATQASVYAIGASPATLIVAADSPLGTDVELYIIPAAGGPTIEIVKEYMTQGYAAFPAPFGDLAAGNLRHWYEVKSVGPATTFKVRTRVYDTGIAPAALHRVAKDVEVRVGKVPRAFRSDR